MLICTAASNISSLHPPIEQIGELCQKRGIFFLVDGAQGAGHFEIKMKELGIDLLTIAGHKGMLGIQGSGALLFSDRIDPRPILFGGTGSMSLSLDMPDFYPDGLEAGTLSFPAILSLLEGTRYITMHQKEMEEEIFSLTEYLLQELSSLKNYVVYSKPNPCGIVAFKHKHLQSEYLAEILSAKYDIAVRGGLHCAPLMHEALGTLDGGLLRVSFSHFNSKQEINVLLTALKNID